MVNGLRDRLQNGDQIVSIEGAERYMPYPGIEGLLGARFNANGANAIVTRKAKFMLFYTTKGILLCHNKFTGFWSLKSNPTTFDYIEYDRDSKSTKDVRVRLELARESGHGKLLLDELRFHDARCLADLEFYEDVHDPREIPRLVRMGMDVVATDTLDPHFGARDWSASDLARALATSRRKEVKLVLLDQYKQAGIGNIAACEALLRARINPFRGADSITPQEIQRIHDAVVKFMHVAVHNEVDYERYILVFRRERCGSCGSAVTRYVQANRGTYACSMCQSIVRNT